MSEDSGIVFFNAGQIHFSEMVFACNTCGVEVSATGTHSCVPFLIKKIEKLEVIVNKLVEKRNE